MLAFVNARIIDGTGRPPVNNTTVLVSGKRITAVGAGLPVPPGARL
jgi:imidazolonepropionase-like amidohydrolase